jgi:hypothetical protein
MNHRNAAYLNQSGVSARPGRRPGAMPQGLTILNLTSLTVTEGGHSTPLDARLITFHTSAQGFYARGC